MASAFFVSPYEDAAILSVDGMGDFVQHHVGHGARQTDERARRGKFSAFARLFLYPCHRSGSVFSNMAMKARSWAWRAMAHPKYSNKYVDKMRDIVRIQRDGSFEFNTDYLALNEGFAMTWDNGSPVLGTMYSKKFVDDVWRTACPGSELTQYQMDVTASLQEMLEEAEFALLNMVHRKTGSDTLCLAGGVAFNSVFNGKIRPKTPFKEIFIQPAAGDAGTALGAAYYIYHQILEQAPHVCHAGCLYGSAFYKRRRDRHIEPHNLTYRVGSGRVMPRDGEMVAEGQHRRLVSGRDGMGSARVGQSEHPGRPAARRYEGHSECAHQAPRKISSFRALGAIGRDR